MMKPSNPITAAIELAAMVHATQRDKADEEYMLHPLEVWRMVRKSYPDNIEAQVVAILHDAFEDFKGTPLELMEFREHVLDFFGQRVFDALEAISKVKGEPHSEYRERVRTNFLARIVKIKDLTHNMDPRRIPSYQIVDKDFKRWAGYREDLVYYERG